MTASPSALTLATARGRRLCKLRRADGTVLDHDRARRLDFATAAAPDLPALAALLAELLHRPDTCALRGALASGGAALSGARRLLHADPATGEAATLADVPRAWLALDLDGLPLPPGTDLRDLAGCARIARLALPDAFHGAGCVAGATAGHGFKPGARLRLWFFLSRPLGTAGLKRWLRDAPVDASVFGAAQPIYTAAPVFDGMTDPLPVRLARLDGAPAVVAPDAAALSPPPRRALPDFAARAAWGHAYGTAALTRAAARIASAPEGTRHPVVLSASWGLARLVARGCLAAGDVRRVVEGAARGAGLPEGEGAAVAEWAIARAGGAA